jgi:hypothetical protein
LSTPPTSNCQLSTAIGVAVLTEQFSLPSPHDWSVLRDDVNKIMALVQGKTCDVSSAIVGPGLKPEGPPPLITHGAPITSASRQGFSKASP